VDRSQGRSQRRRQVREPALVVVVRRAVGPVAALRAVALPVVDLPAVVRVDRDAVAVVVPAAVEAVANFR
jgi:hypothetical protein